jgi:hypothetical protein
MIIATLLAAAAGAVAGVVLAPGNHERSIRPAAPAGPQIGLASGVARIPLPAGWEPLYRHSSLPGLQEATAVRGIRSAVALDIRAPEHASLLPADLVAAAGGSLPAPRRVRMADRSVWRYEIPQPRTPLIALVLPTTGGVVTIACLADSVEAGGAAQECEAAMRGLQLKGASALPLARATAARIALPVAIARLNNKRARGRRALAASRSQRSRSEAAGLLAGAYGAAAARLRPLAAGDARALTAVLEQLAGRHRALAAASARRDARAAARANAAIRRGERRLAPLLASVSRAGTS